MMGPSAVGHTIQLSYQGPGLSRIPVHENAVRDTLHAMPTLVSNDSQPVAVAGNTQHVVNVPRVRGEAIGPSNQERHAPSAV